MPLKSRTKNIAKALTKSAFFVCMMFGCCGLHSAEIPSSFEKTYTPAQLVQAAEALVFDNRHAEAEQLLTELYPHLNADDRVQAEFLLGMIYMAKRDFKTAIWVFRHILSSRPSLTRVRLELARAYFENKDDFKADYHFRLVLGSKDMPDIVKQRVYWFLYQIRARKRLYLFLNLGLSPETNINSVSGRNQECFYFMGVLMCRDLPAKRSGIGWNGYVGAQYFLPVSKKWRIKNEAGFSFNDYPNSSYDWQQGYVSIGPAYLMSKGEIGLYLNAADMFYSGKHYNYSYGADLSFERDLSNKFKLFTAYSFRENRYKYEGLEYMDGESSTIDAKLSYYLSSKTYFTLTNSFSITETENKTSDNNMYRVALGMGTEFPLGISAYLEPSLTLTDYKGGRFFINSGGGMSYAAEHDKLYSISLRLLNRNWVFYGFTPTVGVTYSKKVSNIHNFDYSKTRFSLGVTRTF
ncbi:Protein of unknown function (DUF560) [Parelusimicrobium proximum]|uniref:surface lipoprotein assembly modifier n=1 Tax=Parelusimicrobium proximum TaxID=3228953 RepID=UPI003D16DB99